MTPWFLPLFLRLSPEHAQLNSLIEHGAELENLIVSGNNR